MSNRQKSFTSLLGKDDKATTATPDDKPVAPPTTVLMHTITGNPENPRLADDYTDADPEFAELMDTMREVGQLQPLAVVSHARYVMSKPELAKAVEGADWIVVTGNRRLAAARQLGWTRIDIRVQDRLGEDDQLDDAVIIENIHRKQIDPIKEAEFLKRMVEKHGSQEEVGRRIGKTQMYVSHRLALLKLDDEVRAELEAGAVKPSQVRGLASKKPEEQRAQVEAIKAAAKTPKPRKKAASQNAVLKTESPAPASEPDAGAGAVQNAVLNAGAAAAGGAGEGLPEQRTEHPAPDAEGQELSSAPEIEEQTTAEQNARPVPWDQPGYVARLIRERVADPEFFTLLSYLFKQAAERNDEQLKELLTTVS
jgi:ParB family chromosome partitioning protein